MIKPTVFIILLISIVGYIFCKSSHFTSPKFNKSNGYHTFLLSACYGCGIFVLAFFIYWFCHSSSDKEFFVGFLSSTLINVFKDLAPSIQITFWLLNFIQISIIAMLLAFTLPWFFLGIAMLITKSTPTEVLYGSFSKIADTDDLSEFSSLFFLSNETGIPIAFTLSNRKAYIGYPFHGAKHLNDIMILPLMSGYRCTDELRLELVTDYQPIFDYLLNNEEDDGARFLITIPIREIVHASLHDFGYKDLFKEHEVPRKDDKNKSLFSRLLN
ncbi:MAG: hypothetical protein HRU18_07525 [Pseudoalteromonas sp.]|uniref:hypothetical protein n=1 Tax=Pseudoalteromonas sp. TaxID=53249 RepID=UPI001D8C17B6|nr:hypothetical protein [Pseudoalteromonas sp.]NRA78042.1 hypothetical protein [Pseudoalteromonas sp.]